MAVELMDIDEIIEDIYEGNFKQAQLCTADGTQLIPFNSNKIPLDERLEAIKKRLANRTTDDGVYIIKARYHNSDKKPGTYYTSKGDNITNVQLADGNQVPAQVQPGTVVIPQSKAADLPTEDIMKINAENARLTAENKHLKEKVEQLESELDELESEMEGMGEGKPDESFWKSLSENLVPVLEQHYKHKGDQLAFQRQQLAAQLMNNGQQVPGQQPNGQPAPGQAPPQQEPGQMQQDVEIESLPMDPADKEQLYYMKYQQPKQYAKTLANLKEYFAKEDQNGVDGQ